VIAKPVILLKIKVAHLGNTERLQEQATPKIKHSQTGKKHLNISI